jgi:hypothetical protein
LYQDLAHYPEATQHVFIRLLAKALANLTRRVIKQLHLYCVELGANMEIPDKTFIDIRKRGSRMKPSQARSVLTVLIVGLLALPTVGYASNSESTLTDPATGLMWARQDNGADVDWRESTSHCADLHLGGYSNWRLPTIEEIAAMYDTGEVSKCGQADCHIKAGITLSSDFAWSNNVGKASSEAWGFDFINGERASLIRTVSVSKRALCVRSEK